MISETKSIAEKKLLKWMESTMSLQFSDLLVLSLALSVVPATSSDVNKCIYIFYLYIHLNIYIYICVCVCIYNVYI